MSPLAVVLVSLVPSALIVCSITRSELRRRRVERAARRAADRARHPAARADAARAAAVVASMSRPQWHPPAPRGPGDDEIGAEQ